MPKTDGELADLLRPLCMNGSRAYLEKVGGYAGGVRAPGSAMFNFGRGVGFTEGLLYAWAVPVVHVPPMVWQKRLMIGTKGELSRPDWKRKLQQEAQRRFPQLEVTLKTADALLILDWAMALPGTARH